LIWIIVPRYLYTLLYTLLLPIFVARLWWRGRVNPGYRQRISERFGIIPHRPAANGLWIHAVSVGETLAAAPLVRRFMLQHPNVPVIVTTTTPTGSEQVKRLFGESVFHMYLPYDVPLFLTRFINKLRPGLLIIMETELWPNLLASCAKHRVPVMLANARLSEKSAQGYQKFSKLTGPMLSQLSLVAAQNADDGQRFLALGLAENKLDVTGSIKFDVTVPAGISAKGAELRRQWGSERRVLALASSHPGEDERLLDLYPQLLKACPDLLLMLIPRHPERFEAVTNAVRSRGLRVQRRSNGPATKTTQVYVADSMGEMLQLLAAADVVLMGGSLIERGGHNPIEPAALGKATLIGPNYTNFAAIVDTLVEAEALAVVDADDGLLAGLQTFLADPERCAAMGRNAQQTVDANRGAVEHLSDIAAGFLRL
jgi:3-deoxy-D-manno-octulosonic-acid transferase